MIGSSDLLEVNGVFCWLDSALKNSRLLWSDTGGPLKYSSTSCSKLCTYGSLVIFFRLKGGICRGPPCLRSCEVRQQRCFDLELLRRSCHAGVQPLAAAGCGNSSSAGSGRIPGRPPAACLLSQGGSHCFTCYTMDGQKIILYHIGR